jgi:P-loop Domain of unknown function (DUF2791)
MTSTSAVRGPSGTAPVFGVGEYVDFLAQEYLAGYVALGGSAVKLITLSDEAVGRELDKGLSALAGGFLQLEIDAAGTKIHLIDQLFVALAQQVDWLALAGEMVRRVYQRAGFPATEDLRITAVADEHDVDQAELYRSVRRELERAVLGDDGLSHEFRIAMLRLCQLRLGRGDVTPAERDSVLGWLTGQRVPAADLRAVGLPARVARHNARPLLVSLTRWVRRTGLPGTVLQLDLERLAVARRPPAGIRDGIYYSKAATLDAYEMLRQLIDSTDDLEGLFVAAVLPTELVADERRGIPSYGALHLRVADEVRDRRRANPYAALVRLGAKG